MSIAIRRVRIMAGEPGLLGGARVQLPLARRPAQLRVPRLVQPAAVAGMVAEAAADAGEV